MLQSLIDFRNNLDLFEMVLSFCSGNTSSLAYPQRQPIHVFRWWYSHNALGRRSESLPEYGSGPAYNHDLRTKQVHLGTVIKAGDSYRVWCVDWAFPPKGWRQVLLGWWQAVLRGSASPLESLQPRQPQGGRRLCPYHARRMEWFYLWC